MSRQIQRLPLWLLPCALLLVILQPGATAALYAEATPRQAMPLHWRHLSTTSRELANPSASTQQTAALILDIDQDGLNDFVIAGRRTPGPAMVWFRRTANGWARYLIEAGAMDIEAGGAYHDIDGDGDLDIVMGGDSRSNELWWWENPAPLLDPTTPWPRHLIKGSGATKHHDQLFGDFDGDGATELVFWNQRAKTLFLAEIPSDPRAVAEWPRRAIYQWSDGDEHEGLAQADLDGDGVLDIIGGGRWFKSNADGTFTAQVIDDGQRFARAAAGQLIPGGAPEVVFGCGDCIGPLRWYELRDGQWIGHPLLDDDINHGHSLALADFDGDGALDIFAAEMRLDGANTQARMLVLLGDNRGSFTQTAVASGIDNHESQVGDLNGDGTPDILGKPYNWQTPRLDIWLNERNCPQVGPWQRHVIDKNKPWRSLFVVAGDLDGDQSTDVVTGGWWYRNPGRAGGEWQRQTIGAPLHTVAALYDFDGDGDLDLLGTQGKGSEKNATFAWARNDGKGNFTVLTNIAAGDGDFLQGIAILPEPTGPARVALSWHRDPVGVQQLLVPAAPSEQRWPWQLLAPTTQNEALTAGDIDRDGTLDLLLGTIWLRNGGNEEWQPQTLYPTTAAPDRNQLGDINGDGRLDAIVGYEAISQPGLLAWYEQPVTATQSWIEHEIATVIGPMSLAVADLDSDGDLDVIVGEHNLAEPAQAKLYVFENLDGRGTAWIKHLVYQGDEHHDGALTVDIDGDGDLDIVSIGWGHNEVLLYENLGSKCDAPLSPTVTPHSQATVLPTATPPTAEPVLTTTPTTNPTPVPTAILPTAEPMPTPTPATTPAAVLTATPPTNMMPTPNASATPSRPLRSTCDVLDSTHTPFRLAHHHTTMLCSTFLPVVMSD